MRMCRTLIVGLMVVFGFALQISAYADVSADARKTIQGLYDKRDSAAQKKDIQGTLAALSPDFVFVAKDGQKGDAKLLKRRLTPLFTLMQSVKSKSGIQKFALKGKEATATVKQHLEMLVVNPQTQVPQKFVADATSEDIWTKTGSGWLQKRMTTRAEKAVLDGKSVEDQLNISRKPAKESRSPKKNNQ